MHRHMKNKSTPPSTIIISISVMMAHTTTVKKNQVKNYKKKKDRLIQFFIIKWKFSCRPLVQQDIMYPSNFSKRKMNPKWSKADEIQLSTTQTKPCLYPKTSKSGLKINQLDAQKLISIIIKKLPIFYFWNNTPKYMISKRIQTKNK